MADKATPKADALRAMREARFTQNSQPKPPPPNIADVEKTAAKKTTKKTASKKKES